MHDSVFVVVTDQSSHSCPSLLPYLLPYDFKLSEIAYGRFQTVLVYYIRCRASRHVDSISEGFGGLVSGGEIRSSVNGITEKNPMGVCGAEKRELESHWHGIWYNFLGHGGCQWARDILQVPIPGYIYVDHMQL
ncbi:hypothetical protein ACOSP7_025943 [Xanthoceras sorbifolium]